MRLTRRFGCVFGGLALAITPVAAWAEQAPAPAAAPTPTNKERFVPLEGGRNFRDLGGYRSSDGRSVKWGMIYRSGSMHFLTSRDFETLRELGLRSVIDFRSDDERTREPLKVPEGYALAVYARSYVLTTSEISQSLSRPDATVEHTRQAFEGFYGQLPFTFAEQYREMFRQLLEERAPLVVNCSAGKDRTGVAVALVLTALGVPRDTVIEDYLLSNLRFRPDANDPRMKAMRPEVAAVLYGVDARYLEAAFKAIESRPGGLDGYFRNELGVSSEDLGRLRTLYLQ